MRIEGAHEDVQIRGVVGDLRFGAEPRLGVFGRPPFPEGRDRRGRPPDRVAIAAVDRRRAGPPDGPGHVGWGGGPRGAPAPPPPPPGPPEKTHPRPPAAHEPTRPLRSD